MSNGLSHDLHLGGFIGFLLVKSPKPFSVICLIFRVIYGVRGITLAIIFSIKNSLENNKTKGKIVILPPMRQQGMPVI